MSTRWLHELAIPGTPDISSVYASYAFAAVAAAGLLLGCLTDWWEFFTLGLLAVGFQIPLLVGIALAKFRASLPPKVGHARMFPSPEPFEEIGWFKAFGGLIASGIVIIAFFVYERASAV